MKRIDLKKIAFICSFFVFGFTYGQSIKPLNKETISASYAGVALSFLHYSPDLGHAHDGEHCLADVLTEDWVERVGISEEYAAQKVYQNNMVKHMEGSDRSTYTIPVIFHVIYNTPAENVSEADILDLLDAVNEDFSATNGDVGEARGAFGFDPVDADIEFCLAKQDEAGVPLDEYGIHRVETVETWFDPDTETNKMKGSTGGDTGTEGWDRDRYLNIWICDITNGAGYGVAGYAYKPTIAALPPAAIDGIVIDTDLGMDPSNRVLTHEIGHFLGLDHPWGGGAGSCGTDDGLDDTPNTAGPSFDFVGSCSGDQETCAGTQTQYENYMDYSNCQVMYTEDQANLMSLILDNSRLELSESDVCTAVGGGAPIADFVADILSVIEGGSVNFADLSTNTPTEWAWSISPAAGTSFIAGTSAASENPVVQFSTAGLYSITLVASNAEGEDTNIKTNYIEVIVGGDGEFACDTSRNYTAAEYENVAIYGLAGESGYYPAHATLGDGDLVIQAYAERFNAATPTFVKRLRFPVFQADDIGAASNVTFRVWDDLAGEPGAVLGTEVVALSDLDAGFFNLVDFAGGVAVSGNYWVGAELDYSGGFDTLMFGTTNFDDRPAGASTTSTFVSGGVGWLLTSDLFGSEPNCSLIMDVLTSNGGAPVAVVSFPDEFTCEGAEVTMNGFGSLNADSYYWDISDGVDDYFFDEANLTTSFDEGTWTIQLRADGSCETDLSEVFTMTVNPPMNVTSTTEPENCSSEDGEINFIVTGGSGGPYSYSINDGASFEATSSFVDLNSGTYDYVVVDDENCEELGAIVVANVNDFSPTISPDEIITAGESTELSVTGGVTWNWYAGADFVGSTASITVTPDVTTTYVCNVVDADGCEAVLEVTVTIDDGSGIAGVNLNKSVKMYPNPTNGRFDLAFDFVKEKDLSVMIVNLMGENVLVNSYDGISAKTLSFDLNEFSAGIYFVNIQTETESITKKLILR